MEVGYAGEFFPVTTLLKVLHGPFKNTSKPADKAKMSKVRSILETKWKDWRVGFSHFVQLSSEPSEACVWSMLARHAADIFARGHCGADLFIPIVCPGTKRISMILVRVTDQDFGDFPMSAMSDLNPRSVFSHGNDFYDTDPNGFFRLFMDFRIFNERDLDRFYWSDDQHDSMNVHWQSERKRKVDNIPMPDKQIATGGGTKNNQKQTKRPKRFAQEVDDVKSCPNYSLCLRGLSE